MFSICDSLACAMILILLCPGFDTYTAVDSEALVYGLVLVCCVL